MLLRPTSLPPSPKAPESHDVTKQDSVRRECLDHVRVLGEAHLRRVLREYVAYFNTARPHQGIGQAIPSAPQTAASSHPAARIVAIGLASE